MASMPIVSSCHWSLVKSSPTEIVLTVTVLRVFVDLEEKIVAALLESKYTFISITIQELQELQCYNTRQEKDTSPMCAF